MNEPRETSGADESAPIDDRWIDGAEGPGLASRAGAILRQAQRREPLEAGRLVAIRARLRRDGRRPQRHWSLRLAIALALVLSGSALTAGAQLYFHLLGPTRPAPPDAQTPTAPAPHARNRAHGPRLAAVPEAETPSPAGDPPVPQPETAAPAAPAVPAVHRPRSPVASPPPRPAPADAEPAGVTPPPMPPAESASALAQESALLAGALRKLRQDDDPRGALAILDDHDGRFGAGALAPEATLARIEALIRMHRNGDALRLLDRVAPSPLGRGRDLLIARAELRAAAGRRAAATTDFDLLLTGDLAFDAPAERALWGRASCRAAAGDTAGARRDLQDYLARFPKGRFARDARAALGL